MEKRNAPVFDFHITVESDLISELQAENGCVRIIPFRGSVDSVLFTGTILPGAADVQVTNAAGIRHMCARYMFEGHDQTGQKCRLFVDNNGYFEPGSKPVPFITCPVMMTDSKALSGYLSGTHFRAEGKTEADGLHIRVFDTSAEKD